MEKMKKWKNGTIDQNGKMGPSTKMEKWDHRPSTTTGRDKCRPKAINKSSKGNPKVMHEFSTSRPKVIQKVVQKSWVKPDLGVQLRVCGMFQGAIWGLGRFPGPPPAHLEPTTPKRQKE